MKSFLDTNVLLYAVMGDAKKAERAEVLLAAGPVVSVQVLNELVAVARRKLKMRWDETEDIAQAVQGLCTVEPLTLETHINARSLVQRYAFSWFDALIVAAALAAGCRTLLSEDMHNGLLVDGQLRIVNPFVSSA